MKKYILQNKINPLKCVKNRFKKIHRSQLQSAKEDDRDKKATFFMFK